LERVWVEVELPEGGYMECLLETHRELLYLQVLEIIDDFSHIKMQQAIEMVENKVLQLSVCCQSAARNTCDLCMSSEEIRILFEGRNTISSPSSVDIDPIAYQSGTSRSDVLVGEDYWIVDLDGEGRLISEVVSDLESLMAEINLSFQAFVTSNSTTCDEYSFQSIEDEYNNSTADVRMRLHIDEEEGVLYDVPNFNAIWDHFGEEILDFYDTQYDSLSPQGSQRSGSGSLECKRTNRYKFSASHVFESHEDHYITKSEGLAAHNIIQYYYRAINQPWYDIQLEYKIPEASSKNPGLEPGYADIVNLSTGEIFEIKTVNSWKKGEQEVIIYVDKANEYCLDHLSALGFIFKRGQSYPDKVELPWITSNKRLITYKHKKAGPQYGVISYELEQLDNDWQPSVDPVFIPQTRWDKLGEVLKDMVNSPTPSQVAIDFFNENPDMIAFVAAASIGTIIVIGALATKSLGATLIPTAKLGVAAGILLTVSLTIDIEPDPQGP